jgi:hypothetical protein
MASTKKPPAKVLVSFRQIRNRRPHGSVGSTREPLVPLEALADRSRPSRPALPMRANVNCGTKESSVINLPN